MAFLVNPIVWITSALGVSLLGTLGYALWRHGQKNPYSIGYRNGKKIVRATQKQWMDALYKAPESKPFDITLKEVCDRVFDIGFAFQRKHHEVETAYIDAQMKRVEEEIRAREASLTAGYKSEIELLQSEALVHQKKIQQIEEEYVKQQREGAQSVQAIQEKAVKKQYFASWLAESVRDKLRSAGKYVERDALRYGYACIIVLLVAGDYYITYSIFNDFLKVSTRNSWMIFSVSGIAALVFLVLADFLFDYLEEQSAKNAKIFEMTQKYALVILGTILAVAYILIISVSLFTDSSASRVIDAIMRLLFVPLVVAAAMMIRHIKKEWGFNFVFVPVRFVIFSIGFVIAYAILPFEAAVKGLYAYFAKRKVAPIAYNLSAILKTERERLSGLENVIGTLQQKALQSASRLENEIYKAILPLQKKKDAMIEKFMALRKGCDEAVFTQLSKAQQRT